MPRVDKDTLISEMLQAIPLQKPKPDSAEWWQEVAQGLGVCIHQQKAQIEALTAASAAQEAELARLRQALRKVRGGISLPVELQDVIAAALGSER